jgi:regulator of sigma E protease
LKIFELSMNLSIATLWSKAWPILFALLFFGLVITLHEVGHFIFAKLFKVKVNQFAIGMGPAIIKKKIGETLYAVRLLPMGGYVNMEGEDEDSNDDKAFGKKPIWQRFIIVSAGAIFNLITGLVIVAVMLSQQSLIGTTQIRHFDKNAISHETGLQPGDRIIRIDGMKIFSDSDISYALLRSTNEEYDFVVDRNGVETKVNGVKFARQASPTGKGDIVRVDFVLVGEEVTVGRVLKNALVETASMGRIVRLTLVDLVRGKYGINDLSGPIGTINMIAGAASDAVTDTENGRDFTGILSILAFISINLGIFNLMPIPALDGGRLFFFVVEAIRRKPIPPKYEAYVHAVGFALLIGLMVIVSINDIFGVFR